MRKYMSIFDPSHEKLIEFINRYYTRRGWRIISIVKGNGNFWATLNWKRRKRMTKEELMSAITGLPAETQIYKIGDYADLDHSDGCPLLGVIVVNEPDSEPIIYLR
jgi:hypothetical protein